MLSCLGNLPLIYLLLHYGADPNVVDIQGQSLLTWVITANIHPELLYDFIRLLCRYKCVFSRGEGSTGNTILHHLAMHYNDNMAQYTPIIISICKHVGVECLLEWRNLEEESVFQVRHHSLRCVCTVCIYVYWIDRLERS